MFDPKIIDEMSKKFTEALPSSLQSLKADMEANFRTSMQYALGKLDLVTREEFDVQTNVLSKTREKLDQLEQRVTELETELARKKPE